MNAPALTTKPDSTDERIAPAVTETTSTEPRMPARPRGPVLSRRALRALGIVTLLCVAIWLVRVPLLTAVARTFIVDDPLPEKADAITVLGGGMHFRPTEAARLYQLGLAPKILVAYPIVTPEVALGMVAPEGEIATAFIEQLGVPAQSIEPLGYDVSSTYDEALAARKWLGGKTGGKLLIPTDAFRTRRVKWVFEKTLRGTDAEICVTAIDPIRYSASNWWQREEGRNTLLSEAGKLLYYWAKY